MAPLDHVLAAIYRSLITLCYPASHRDRFADDPGGRVLRLLAVGTALTALALAATLAPAMAATRADPVQAIKTE